MLPPAGSLSYFLQIHSPGIRKGSFARAGRLLVRSPVLAPVGAKASVWQRRASWPKGFFSCARSPAVCERRGSVGLSSASVLRRAASASIVAGAGKPAPWLSRRTRCAHSGRRPRWCLRAAGKQSAVPGRHLEAGCRQLHCRCCVCLEHSGIERALSSRVVAMDALAEMESAVQVITPKKGLHRSQTNASIAESGTPMQIWDCSSFRTNPNQEFVWWNVNDEAAQV